MGKKQLTLRMILFLVMAAFLASESTVLLVTGRYLPTRSQDDKIERLRELLKDLLESQNVNTRQQADMNYDQTEAVGSGGLVQLGGLGGNSGSGSSGRSILFKRDITEQDKSGLQSRASVSHGPFEGSPHF